MIERSFFQRIKRKKEKKRKMSRCLNADIKCPSCGEVTKHTCYPSTETEEVVFSCDKCGREQFLSLDPETVPGPLIPKKITQADTSYKTVNAKQASLCFSAGAPNFPAINR